MSTCRLFHDWGKWEDDIVKVTPNIAYPYGVEYGEPYYETGQQKVCKRCGKKKVRMV